MCIAGPLHPKQAMLPVNDKRKELFNAGMKNNWTHYIRLSNAVEHTRLFENLAVLLKCCITIHETSHSQRHQQKKDVAPQQDGRPVCWWPC
jgi:hypothetical protein